ncbi:hypothetical protein PG996_004523 [Apiospora saccharicola]|uniref:Uncharacterized protein n=1 Tax=Apiospora saccharicola TaxID=335842 RepID=A0ABR1W4H0_9PEZI
MVPFNSLDFVAYVIHDGWRLNLTGDYIISLNVEGGRRSQVPDDNPNWILPLLGGASMQAGCRGQERSQTLNCQLKNSTSYYASQYGFYGLHNETTVWPTENGNVTLAAPSLNISAFYLHDASIGDGYGYDWVDPRTGQKPFSDEGRVAWTAANQTFTMDEITAKATCQPVQNVSTRCSFESVRWRRPTTCILVLTALCAFQQYQWGFSLMQLLIAIILMGLWMSGLCVMSHTSSRHDPLEGGQPEVLRGWRALLTLAEAMNMELAGAGIEPHTLKDDELQEQIDRHIDGGQVYSKSGGGNVVERRGFPYASGGDQ